MQLTPKRLYFLLMGVVGLGFVVLVLGVYGADMLLRDKSAVVRNARLESMVLEEKQRQLSRARADILKYQGLANIAKHIVPQDKDQARTVREIVKIAGKHNIKLGAVTFPVSSLGDASAKNSQLIAVPNIPGVLGLDITVQSDSTAPASFASLLKFLDALEHNRRTALVKNISLQPDAANPGKLTFTLTLSEFIKP